MHATMEVYLFLDVLTVRQRRNEKQGPYELMSLSSRGYID